MITQEQRELRRDRVGSSDTPAILGVDLYRNAHDVFAEKVYALAEVDNAAIRFGNLFESALVAWAAEQLGIGDVEVDVSLQHTDGVLAANLDGLSRKHRCVIEAKTTGMSELWGDEGTDQVPERVIAQNLHQIEVCDNLDRPIEIDVVWVPVLLARFDRPMLGLYKVARDDRGQAGVADYGRDFWERYVVPRRPPLNLLPSLDVLTRIKRVPESIARVDPQLVYAYESAKDIKKEAEEREELAKRALLTALGDSEAADFGDSRQIYTYFEQGRANVNVTKLRTLRPDIFAQFDSSSRFRVLRRSKR